MKRWLAGAVLFSLATVSDAMRLSDIEEFATLTVQSEAQCGERTCAVAGGTAVRVIGQTTNISDKTTASSRAYLFVRVADGPCVGYELTVAENALTDFRETLKPSASAPNETQKPPSKLP